MNYLEKVRLSMPVWNHRRYDLYPSMIALGQHHFNSDKDFYTFGQVNYFIFKFFHHFHHFEIEYCFK